MKKLFSILTIFALIFTAMPMAGGFDASAASKLPKVKDLSATSKKTSITLKWKLSKTNQKKVSNIIIYRFENNVPKKVKTLKKDATSFKVKNLSPGKKYTFVVKTRKATGKKWYNKKTKKWQKEKPKKKYRGKSKNTYSYSSSAAVTKSTTKSASKPKASTIGGSSGSSSSSSSEQIVPGNRFNVDENCYFTYKGTKIYLGQTWTNDLYTTLKSKSNGIWTGTRKNCTSSSPSNSNLVDENVYLFNTNTYDPFLAVYVSDGQIVSFADNAETLAVIDGHAVHRRDNESTITKGSCWPGNTDSAEGALIYFANVSNYFGSAAYFGTTAADYKRERDIGYHFINAARVAFGVSILTRNKWLEGVDLNTNQNLTYTGDVVFDNIPTGETITETYTNGETLTWEVYGTETRHAVNQRFGAQAHAESCMASHYYAHDLDRLTAGPLATETYNNTVIDNAAGGHIRFTELNIPGSGGGELALHWKNDHVASLLYSKNVSIGLGYAREGNNCITIQYIEY